MSVTPPRRLVPAFGACVALIAASVAAPAGAQEEREPPAVERIAGAERFETAARLAAAGFPDGADVVHVATGHDFPDALAGAPVAAAAGGPILLVRPGSVPEATRDAIDALSPERVVIFGGRAAVSDAVATELERLSGADTSRVHGATRFETAAALAGTFAPGVPVAYVASGADFPDALSGGAAAAAAGGPVLLVEPGAVPQATRAALQQLEPEAITVLGGTMAVSAAVAAELEDLTDGPVRRLGGADRFETSAAVAAAGYPAGADVAYLATGTSFPDALATGPVAGLAQAPLLLATRNCVPLSVLSELDRLGVERVVLAGGGAALSEFAARLVPCGRETSVVAERLQVPWDVAFTPDGRTFVTERDTGRLLRLTGGAPEVVQEFPVAPAGEGGLLGLAASPDFAEDGLLYAYFTSASDNRVVRFRPGEAPEAVVTGIPRSTIHNGGRLAFGPDGMLYVATGDAGTPARSQDWGSLAGKILRVRPDGSVPPDNPVEGSRAWARGLRNVQGLAFAADGTLYATEFGPECDDEVNVIVRGGNYGWPDACGETRPGAIPPIVVRQPPEASWSGAALLAGGSIPEWEGDLFAAALRGRRLWRFAVDGDRVTGAQQLLAGEFGRLRHVEQAPDGSLWILTSNRDGRGSPTAADDRIIRIGPPRR